MRLSKGYVKRWAGVASAAALLATAATSLAPAATLDQQTCDQLKLEIGQLEGMGARESLSKGATWGKANLRAAQLEQVKKLIEMDETVAFRCPRPKPEPQAAAAASGKAKAKVLGKVPAKAQAGEAKAVDGKSVDGKSGDPQAKPRPKAKPPAPKAAEGDPAASAPAPPKPRPKPAPKPADAASPAPAPKAPPAQ